MENAEYIDIILIGYFKEREYFKQYLIRQFKIAESEHIEEHEFFSKCLDVVQLIADKLNKISKMEGGYNFKIPLTYFSKKFNKGHIDWDDLKEITLRIKEAKDSIIIIEEPQLIKTKNPDEVKRKNEFKLKENNFDKVQPDKVINHFKQLVDNGYITQLNFEIFIKTVFEKNQIVTSKIEIIKPNSKSRVKKIFYSYYETYATQKYGVQKKYIELLSNNFIGFNYVSLSTNFSK